VAAQLGLPGLRIATVTGDDLMPRLDALAAAPGGLSNAETGQPWREFPGPALFTNAYLGARPIVAALAEGANIVITGRVADPALFLAPLIYEFGWAAGDWDLLAAGTAIGHLCECSGQATGGNFSGEWWTIAEPWKLAYPIAECEPDGTAVIGKPPGTGGRVDFDTVRHQLLYEVHDPAAYVTPDVVADFAALRLEDLGGDRVRVSGARGRQATTTYKALACHPAGWSGEARVAFGWPDAHAKARATEVILRKRIELAGIAVDEWLAEYWGVNALHGPAVPPGDTGGLPEVLLRMAWRCADAETAGRVGRELVPLALSAPPWGMTGAGRGMTGRPSQLLGLWPTLVPKDLVDEQVHHDITDIA
jgi:Acyclic terpene utilisation family protein AtuA